MFNIQIMLYVLAIPFILFGIGYGLFPKQTKNLLMKLIPAWKKRYVICHMRYQGGLSEVFYVIPNLQGLTQVGKYSYQLIDKYSCFTWNNRLHFVLDENDAIPRNFEIQTKESVIFQSAEIQTALNNSVMDYLFSRKKEMLIIGLFIVAIIAILAIVYNIIQTNELKELIKISVTQNQIVPVGRR